MIRYRIKFSRGYYYAQRRGMFFWRSLPFSYDWSGDAVYEVPTRSVALQLIESAMQRDIDRRKQRDIPKFEYIE